MKTIKTETQIISFRVIVLAFLMFLGGSIIAATPVSAAPQALSLESKGQLLLTGSPLIVSSSPTNANFTVNRATQSISGYMWSQDIGWISFTAGVAVGTGGTVTGTTPVLNGIASLDFNSSPSNAQVTVTPENQLLGHAWSSDIGWIHFDGNGNATALGTGAKIDINEQPMRANVVIDDITGDMSGYAWNSDLGWIDFTGVKVNTNGTVTGEATVQNTTQKIHFDASPYNSNVQVSSTGQFSGYAWNSDLGWIQMNGINTKNGRFPVISAPGKVRNLTLSPVTNSSNNGQGAIQLNWLAPASDGGSEITDYKIEYCRASLAGVCQEAYQVYDDGVNTNLTTTINNLINDETTHYNFRVSAINAAGAGEISDVVTARAGYVNVRVIGGNLALSLTPTASSASFSSGSQSIKLDSNIVSGVQLRLSTQTTNNNLVSASGDQITPISASMTSPQSPALNTWGYRIDGGNFGTSTTLETGVANSAFTWAQVPPRGQQDVILTTSGATDVTTPVYYGVRVDSTKPSGSYSSQVIYEAVGR